MKYVGEELELFRDAKNWRNYWFSLAKPYLKGEILEVGSGIGSVTKLVDSQIEFDRLIALEPDLDLSEEGKKNLSSSKSESIIFMSGFLKDLPEGLKFDAILYIDVLEHIDDDNQEIARALECLKEGGVIVILSPAHQALFSEFDAAIGHYRRYSKRAISNIFKSANHQTKQELSIYLDSVGVLTSLANKLLLRQSNPTKAQIYIWDKYIIPVSKILDKITFFKFGKSLLVVYKK
jgi:SAM-dependent methyltransferase